MKQEKQVFSLGTILQLLIFIVGVPLLPLLISGQWGWWEAWIYAAINILGFAVSRILVGRKHPDLLQERARAFQHKDAAAWDKVLSPLLALGGAVLPLTAGLDARLNGLGEYELFLTLIGLGAILAGYLLGSWALITNRYFSGMVRIQHDRDHQVVSTGPYRWVRHPGYLGVLLSYLGTPLLLGSSWAFLPAGILGVGVVIRTHLEDRTLRKKLEGYQSYTERVRSRLIPGIW